MASSWNHAPLPDAACLAAALPPDAHAVVSPLTLEPHDNPFRCDLGDDAACGEHGRCVGYGELYDARWSRDADADDTCFWLAWHAGRDAEASSHGLCQCDERHDGDGCGWCAAGWSGDGCATPHTALRRSLASHSAAELSGVKQAFVGLIAPNQTADWTHSTVVKEYPTECGGAPHHPHASSVWLVQWHRPLLRLVESSLLARQPQLEGLSSIEGLPYWRTTGGAAEEAAYALHPELLEGERDGCPRVSLRALGLFIGVERAAVLRDACPASDNSDDDAADDGAESEAECLLSKFGISVESVYDEEAMLSQAEFGVFLELVKHMHVHVHCWMAAVGYVQGGCNEGTVAELYAGATGEAADGEVVARCTAPPTIFANQGDDSPLFFAFHTYLDALLERWMKRHGYDAACDAALLRLTDGLWRGGNGSGDFRDAHPDACVAQSLLSGASLSLRDTCRPAAVSWGYEYADDTYETERRGRDIILGGFGFGAAVGAIVTFACVAGRLLAERREKFRRMPGIR